MRAVVLGSLFLSVLFIASPSQAVLFEGVGVKGGTVLLFNDFQFDGEKLLELETATGFSAGAFAEWKTSRKARFRIMTGLDYVRKGYKGERNLPGDSGAVDVDVSADYLSASILMRNNFVADELSVYGIFGPTFEFLIDNDVDAILDDFKSFSIAGTVGMGVDKEMGDRMKVLAEIRFSTDLLNSYNAPEGSTLSTAKFRSLYIVAGFRFR